MKKFKFENFIRGWLIGNFEPSILKTKEIEVGIKHYKKSDGGSAVSGIFGTRKI